jgi:tyrosinase
MANGFRSIQHELDLYAYGDEPGDGVRRNAATIPPRDRELLVDAILKLARTPEVFPAETEWYGALPAYTAGWRSWTNTTRWEIQEQFHRFAHARGFGHDHPFFIPWHRLFIYKFEFWLRAVHRRLSLPYWDWTTDPRPLFTPEFMGSDHGNAGPLFGGFKSAERDGEPPEGIQPDRDPAHAYIWRNVGNVGDVKFGGLPTLPTVDEDKRILEAETFQEFHTRLKAQHDIAHKYIGGTLAAGGPWSLGHFAAQDPFAFLLHSNMDRLWASWQNTPDHPERRDIATWWEGQELFGEQVLPWALINWGGPEGEDRKPYKTHPRILPPPVYDVYEEPGPRDVPPVR